MRPSICAPEKRARVCHGVAIECPHLSAFGLGFTEFAERAARACVRHGVASNGGTHGRAGACVMGWQ